MLKIARQSRRLLVCLPLLGGALIALGGCESQPAKLRAQGIELYNRGDYQGAVQKFDAALQNDPAEYKGNYYAGAADYNLGRYSEAAYHYKLAWQANPKKGDVKVGFAESLIKEGKKDEAFDFLERDATLNNNVDDRIRVAELYAKYGDLDNAELNYQKAAAIQPTTAKTQVECGTFLERIGKHEQAADAFKKAYALDPNYPGITVMLQRNGVPLAQVIGR